MSSDFSGEITAIATGVLAAFAIITAVFAFLAFLAYRKQTQEVDVLLDQHDRDVAERRIAQAARVFTVVPSDPVETVTPSAKNAIDLPVFDVQFWYSQPGGASGPDDLGRIMPGDMAGTSQSFSPDDAVARTILTFRDAAGVSWIRMPDGALEEQSCATARESALVALGVELPLPGLRPPGPGGKHKLPTSFSRSDRLVGFAKRTDRIVVHPVSKGTLYLDSHWLARSEDHLQLEVTSNDPDNQGVYVEKRRADNPNDPARYTVSYDVWNYTDSPVIAQFTETDTAGQEQADNSGPYGPPILPL
jgi:hypothetical protein